MSAWKFRKRKQQVLNHTGQQVVQNRAESPSSNLLPLIVKAAWGQFCDPKTQKHGHFQTLEIVKQITVAWRRTGEGMISAF